MQNSKNSKVVWLIPTLLMLAAILLDRIFGNLFDKVFPIVQQAIDYKTLLQVTLLLLVLLVSLYFHSRQSVANSRTVKQTKRNLIAIEDLKQSRIALLENLASDEKALLKQCIENDSKSIRRGINDGVSMALRNKGILELSVPQIGIDYMWTYIVSEWPWELLKKSPKCLK